MNRAASILFLGAVLLLPLAPALAVTIDTVYVGHVGNVADTQVMSDGTTGYGSVAYDFRMGTYEVTNSQYAEFLKAKAADDPLGLYDSDMGDYFIGGITRSGSAGNFTYNVKENMGNKPVNFVDWYDAIRFANWLHNGLGAGDTETGAYTLEGGTPVPSNALTITRNSGAVWFLPSEDEWYKAAYYDANPIERAGFEPYWDNPTRSNNLPNHALANDVGDITNPGYNVINYGESANWNDSVHGNVTSVGTAGFLSRSYYGTSDQGGNVFEWNEALIQVIGTFWNRGVRGGAFTSGFFNSGARRNVPATQTTDTIGFRVATIPEPSTLILAAFGIAALVTFGLRRRR